ncbi:hypothetical protein HPB49_002264 [Dermacentor silvarum]|uniref:Uncharacterized protein n=1 Tax=Dermacentor silvarum TaxID=543639 RepID=A0ACB8CNS5_DERSI|nr:hypothetical protein HPB49_002264 [Dermacentor silvarum]
MPRQGETKVWFGSKRHAACTTPAPFHAPYVALGLQSMSHSLAYDTAARCEPTPPTASQIMDAFETVRYCIGAHDDNDALALLAGCKQKAEEIRRVEHGGKKSDVTTAYSIPRSTLSTILKNKADVRAKADKRPGATGAQRKRSRANKAKTLRSTGIGECLASAALAVEVVAEEPEEVETPPLLHQGADKTECLGSRESESDMADFLSSTSDSEESSDVTSSESNGSNKLCVGNAAAKRRIRRGVSNSFLWQLVAIQKESARRAAEDDRKHLEMRNKVLKLQEESTRMNTKMMEMICKNVKPKWMGRQALCHACSKVNQVKVAMQCNMPLANKFVGCFYGVVSTSVQHSVGVVSWSVQTRKTDITSKSPSTGTSLAPVETVQVHLGDGLFVSSEQWAMLMRLPRDSLFCKEGIRCLWTADDLQDRSVTGLVCRRFIRAEVPRTAKRPLTPVKLRALGRAYDHYIAHHPADNATPYQRGKKMNCYLAEFLQTYRRR